MEKALNVQNVPFHPKLKIQKIHCKVCNFMVVDSISLKRFHNKDTSKELTRIIGLSECWKVFYCVFRLQIFPKNLLFVKLVEWEAKKFSLSFHSSIILQVDVRQSKINVRKFFLLKKNEIFQFKYFLRTWSLNEPLFMKRTKKCNKLISTSFEEFYLKCF
jgi:hypothetical protein